MFHREAKETAASHTGTWPKEPATRLPVRAPDDLGRMGHLLPSKAKWMVGIIWQRMQATTVAASQPLLIRNLATRNIFKES